MANIYGTGGPGDPGDPGRADRPVRAGDIGSGGDAFHVLADLHFPASKRQILGHAQSRNVNSKILDDLDGLPDTVFESVADVIRSIGGPDSGNMPA